jgi:hypothetical protein
MSIDIVESLIVLTSGSLNLSHVLTSSSIFFSVAIVLIVSLLSILFPTIKLLRNVSSSLVDLKGDTFRMKSDKINGII